MGLAAVAALVAVALDLPGELLDDEVQRVVHVRRGVARAQRHPLQVERRLGDLAVGDRGVALLVDLDLQAGQLRDLLDHLAQAALQACAAAHR